MGEKIGFIDGKLVVPDMPVIPYIRGDGVGVDVTPVMQKVIDDAVLKAYGGERRIDWLRLYAGEDAYESSGVYLPDVAEYYRIN